MSDQATNYQHAEAFCLMDYVCESSECGSRRRIWNSRDGVTPFIVDCSDCEGAMKHDNWNRDRRAPDYEPLPTQLVFVDATKDDALRWAEEAYKRYQGTEFEIPPERKVVFVRSFVADFKEGEPKLVTWGEHQKAVASS